jgi:hypothetical protein
MMKAKQKPQLRLNFSIVKAPTEFTRDAVLEAVTRHIACDDQALMLADKPTFRNCLVIMRPKTKMGDLPSTHDVRAYLRNVFVQHLNQLKQDIEVSLFGFN